MSRLQKLVYVCIADNNTVEPHYTLLGGLLRLDRDLNMDINDRVNLEVDLEDMFNIELKEKQSLYWITVDDVIDSVIQAGGAL